MGILFGVAGIRFLRIENSIPWRRLEFTSMPEPSTEPNNKSARLQPQIVKDELLRLEKLGCVHRVSGYGHSSHVVMHLGWWGVI